MPFRGLADECMVLEVVPAAAGEDHGICVLSNLHITINQKNPTYFHMLACF